MFHPVSSLIMHDADIENVELVSYNRVHIFLLFFFFFFFLVMTKFIKKAQVTQSKYTYIQEKTPNKIENDKREHKNLRS
jgi:hypothetical protein